MDTAQTRKTRLIGPTHRLVVSPARGHGLVICPTLETTTQPDSRNRQTTGAADPQSAAGNRQPRESFISGESRKLSVSSPFPNLPVIRFPTFEA